MSTFHISPDGRRRQCSAPENCKFSTSAPLEPKNNGSYYGTSVPAGDIASIVQEWGSHVGYSRAEELMAKKDERDGGRKFHLTVLSPKETRQLRKQGADLSGLDTAEIHAIPQGVGRVENSEGDEVWFITVSSPSADTLRESLGLGPKDHHITLGFTNKDIHGVPKDESTLVQEITPAGNTADNDTDRVHDDTTDDTFAPTALGSDGLTDDERADRAAHYRRHAMRSSRTEQKNAYKNLKRGRRE